LNWKWLLALIACFVFAFVMGIFSALEPSLDVETLDLVVYAFYIVVMIAVSIWVLVRKNRSLAWIFLIGWFSPLWLSNKRNDNIYPPTVQ